MYTNPIRLYGIILYWLAASTFFAPSPASARGDEYLLPVHLAVLQENLPAVKEMLDIDQDVNARTAPTQKTPLHLAARTGTVEMARILLRRGAELNARDHWGMTPLHEAAEAGRPDMVDFLLTMGANSRAQDFWGFTPFHSLVWKSADFDHPRQQHAMAARVMLRHGVKLDIPNLGGRTAMDTISRNRFGIRRKVWLEVESFILKGSEPRD